MNKGNVQVKFHPTKQNGSRDIRLPMESSWSPLSNGTISFKYMQYLSMVSDCQRKSVILRWKKIESIFKLNSTKQKKADDQKKYFTLFLHTIRQTKNNSHKHLSHFFFFQLYLLRSAHPPQAWALHRHLWWWYTGITLMTSCRIWLRQPAQVMLLAMARHVGNQAMQLHVIVNTLHNIHP